MPILVEKKGKSIGLIASDDMVDPATGEPLLEEPNTPNYAQEQAVTKAPGLIIDDQEVNCSMEVISSVMQNHKQQQQRWKKTAPAETRVARDVERVCILNVLKFCAKRLSAVKGG